MMLRGQSGGDGSCLFTESQWEELENQALIFKYMATGKQVPHELVLQLRHRDGFAIDTAPSLAFPPSQASLGWGCYGAAAQYGRKAEDLEPGRCRRTDGKKWRCSREAYGESKYCDKHMHRGKNRSRKPVEATPSSAGASYRPSALSISPPTPDAPPNYGYHHHLRPDAFGRAAAQINPLQLYLDTAAHPASPPPSYHSYAQCCSSPLFPTGYGGCGSREHEEAEARRRQHCLALGADLSLDKPDVAAASSTEKPLRRFFDDWPRDKHMHDWPWVEKDQDGTQLSISISTTTASSDLSRYHHGNE